MDIGHIKGIVLFRSRYGDTTQYMEWIREITGFDSIDLGIEQDFDLNNYNIIIIGSSIRFGKLIVSDWLNENYKRLSEKKIIIFSTGIFPLNKREKNRIIKKSIPKELHGHFKFFSLSGKLEYKRMHKRDRYFIRIGRLLLFYDKKKRKLLYDHDNLSRSQLEGIFRECSIKLYLRWYLSRKYLKHGSGIEIGPSFLPLDILPELDIKYVDIASKEEQYEKYHLLQDEELVDIDIIDNGEELNTFENNSLDFIIANHVIEHALNPIQTISNFLRVLKNEGIIFLSVPSRPDTFDKTRPLTEPEHIIEVYETGIDNDIEQHYIDVVSLVEKLPPNKVKDRVEYLMNIEFSIHYHTYELSNFLPIISYMEKKGFPLKILESEYIPRKNDEFIIIIQKIGVKPVILSV